MDKNAIKKYAVWARRELISRVSQRAALYEITDKGYGDASADSVLGRVMSAEEKRQRQALIAQIREKGYEQVMEEIAYTWFNRFIALRFMEVNGYLPSRVRVFTDDENNFKPQILAEAINMELDGLDMEKVYALKNANDDDALFKYMIIVQCNALSSILPGMFQHISDYTELLFPDNLLREGSVIEQMVSMIPEEDWTDQVQIIGWLYQYYNTEPKDKVFADLKKNIKISKENIPAATQLFTPDWIVRYMVENSLGRLWLEGHPNDELKATWKYYLDEAEQEPDVQAQLADIRKEYSTLKPEDIRAIDPCQGSGHILAYMFDVLVQIYESYGYTAREAAASIVEHNIWGLDIDDRAAQLAYFSVMMKARQYDRRFFSRGIQPHVHSIIESNNLDQHCIEYFSGENQAVKTAITTLVDRLRDAKEYGSILDIPMVDFASLYARFEEINSDDAPDIYSIQAVDTLLPFVQVAHVMAQKYSVVVTNPPYMSASGMGHNLYEYVRKHYKNTKADMSTVCMEKTIDMCLPNGFMAMINIPVWMSLPTYRDFRYQLLHDTTIVSMSHNGRGIFGSDFGSTAFVIRKSSPEEYEGVYARLFVEKGQVDTVEEKERMFLERFNRYSFKQCECFDIPDTPLAYWETSEAISIFKYKKLGETLFAKTGVTTGDNEIFLRFWHEISQDKWETKWFPLNKGGEYRKWYGNNDYVINWENHGAAIKAFPGSTIRNEEFYFRDGVTWSKITAAKFSARFSPATNMFDAVGLTCFTDGVVPTEYILAYLCSKVVEKYVKILNQTVSYTVGTVNNLPFVFDERTCSEIVALASENISIAREDWDSFETSWDYREHPFITAARWASRTGTAISIGQAYEDWKGVTEGRFQKIKDNEEKLNQIFIEMYGLSNELTPEVEDKDVTIRLADPQREIRSFISYAVGCMFGRYSLSSPGLAYAGGEWDETRYGVFSPDQDAILPICDDEYFEDDIVGRFILFVEKAFGKEMLEENLHYIAENIGGKGAPREVIRNYFINEFYVDHLKVYQKRPIYWLFDSGKKNGFKCLIYMHRYQPDTIARIRTDYVHEQQSRYRTAIADLESRIANAGTGERVKLSKQLTKLQEQAEELRVYEEKIHHLADQMIRIDLDDGVKHNYAIFQDVLAKIK